MVSISVVIPTLNSATVLEKCLSSIRAQKYPKAKVEIIIVDGGSSDDTLKIARKYLAKIIHNPLKTAEAGKALGVKVGRGEIIALIDSDNILPTTNWFKRMVRPFKNPEIILSEPIKYTYRRSDPYLTRYFALLGMNDPICLFIGNYDRYSYLTKRWTGLIVQSQSKKPGYLQVTLSKEPIPTIGANGTMIRRVQLKPILNKTKYLFDIDILLRIIRQKGEVKIAKVNVGIIHTFVEDHAGKFFLKQLRRISDLSFHQDQKNRALNWEKTFVKGIFKFIISCILVMPIIFQTLVGYFRRPDKAWFFHPIACYSTLLIYIYGWVKGKIAPAELNRKDWKQ